MWIKQWLKTKAGKCSTWALQRNFHTGQCTQFVGQGTNRWWRNQTLTLSGNLTYRRTRGDAGWSEPSSWSHRETTIRKLGELAVLKISWEAGAKWKNTLTRFLSLSSNLSWLVPKGQSYLPSRRLGGPEKCSSLLPAAEGREGWSSFAH